VSRELLVRGRAKADIRRAAKSYERQKHRNIRHAITRDFSYGVFYRIRGNKISVFGVLHLHRDDVRFRTRPRIRGRLPALVALPSLADHLRTIRFPPFRRWYRAEAPSGDTFRVRLVQHTQWFVEHLRGTEPLPILASLAAIQRQRQWA
jgi:hypothetical protein